jgi:hypothetical protein
MWGKITKFPVEPLNNFSFSFQLYVPFTYGPGVQPILLTASEHTAGSVVGELSLQVAKPFCHSFSHSM